MTLIQAQFVMRGEADGETLDVMGGRYTFKALNQETGAYTLVEVQAPKGFAVPAHVHDREEEGFYVARGSVTIFVGDDGRTLEAGGFALVPRGTPHTFRLESADATLLLLVSPGPAHEGMFRAMADPPGASSDRQPDLEALGRIAASHGTRIVGPPPGP